MSTKSRCKKRALLGSKYCFLHQSWGFNAFAAVATLILGAILGLAVNKVYSHFFPSPETQGLVKLQEQYEKNLKKPEFIFLLNGKKLFIDSIVTYPATRSIAKLMIAAQNVGNLSSEQLLVTIRYPRMATHVTPTNPWQEHSPQFIGEGDVEEEPHLKFYAYRTNEIIPPGDALEFPEIIVKDPQKNSPVLPFGLQIASDKSEVVRYRLHFVFKDSNEDFAIREVKRGNGVGPR